MPASELNQILNKQMNAYNNISNQFLQIGQQVCPRKPNYWTSQTEVPIQLFD